MGAIHPKVNDFLDRKPWYTPVFAESAGMLKVDISPGVIKEIGVKAKVEMPKQHHYIISIDSSLVDETFDNVLEHELWHVMLDHFGRIPRDLKCGLINPGACKKCTKKRRNVCKILADGYRMSVDASINPFIFPHDLTGKDNDILMPSQLGLPEYRSMEWYYSKIKKSKKMRDMMEHSARVQAGLNNMFEDMMKDVSKMLQKGASGKGEQSSNQKSKGDPSDSSSQGKGESNMEPDIGGKLDKMVWDQLRKKVVVKFEERNSNGSSGRSSGHGSNAGTSAGMAKLGSLVGVDVDWRSKMRKGIFSGATVDVKYKKYKVDKRYGTSPGMVIFQHVKPLIVIDTSSSINYEQLGLFRKMINKSARDFNGAWVIEVDTIVQAMYPLGNGIPEDHVFKGRGGTDFRPAFELFGQGRFDVLVYFTDGEGTYPRDYPKEKTIIWALQGGRIKVKWGEVVMIDPDSEQSSEQKSGGDYSEF